MNAELPPSDHAARRRRARRELARQGLELLLVTDPLNVRYLTGFHGTNGQLLLAADPPADRLVTDERYAARAAAAAPDLTLVLSRDPVGAALGALRDHRTPRLGFEAGDVSWQVGQRLRERAAEDGVEAVATSGVVETLRAVKDDAEVARLAHACAITVAALTWLIDEVVAPGSSEHALAIALERRFVDLGADGPAFPSIVASGPNAAIPHHEPGARPLEAGDVLVVDCGAVVDGYHADCTRTVAVGHLAAPLTEVHDVVRRAQEAGRRAARAGVAAGEVDQAARSIVEAAGFGEWFVHGTGHGVGLAVHEAPAVSRGARATLAAGTALTVEPGIYLPGIGGVRIEDTIVVTAGGPPRTLTDAPRELRVR